MSEISLEMVREVIRDVIAERDRRAEDERLAQERAEQEQLASIRRCNLSPREKSDLINRIGYEKYMQVKFDDQLRGSDGRYRPR